MRAILCCSSHSGLQKGPTVCFGQLPNGPTLGVRSAPGASHKKPSMNVKRGTRRLGIVLGLCGAILGGYLARSYARAVWHNYMASRRFESLMASPTIEKVAKAIRENNDPIATYPWINYRFNEHSGKLEYQADIQSLLNDPRFQSLDTSSQKLVLGQIDTRFSGLSD